MSESAAVVWVCGRCGEATASGSLRLTAEQGKAASEHAAWEHEQGSEGGGTLAQAFANTPPRGHWEVVCQTCLVADPAESYYGVRLETLATQSDLIAETARLMGKQRQSWFWGTDWDSVLRGTLTAGAAPPPV